MRLAGTYRGKRESELETMKSGRPEDCEVSPFPEPKLTVLAFGFDALGTKPDWSVTVQEEVEVEFRELGDARTWEPFDVIVFDEACFYRFNPDGWLIPHVNDVLVCQKQALSLLKSNSAVCCLFQSLPETGLPAQSEGGYYDPEEFSLANSLLQAVGVPCFPASSSFVEHVTRHHEFRAFIDKYGICSSTFDLRLAEDVSTICTAGEGGDVTGFENQGKLFFLPCHFPAREAFTTAQVVSEVARAIRRYQCRRALAPPDWLDEAVLPGEERLRTRRAQLLGELEQTSSRVAEYDERKRILHAQDDALVDAVCDSLRRMGLRTKPGEKAAEDFWLVNEEGEEIAIGEVKALEKNVTTGNVSQVDTHRSWRDLGQDFPGILIVNTFRSAHTFADKHQQIEPKVRRHGIHNNVLVLRTLDLFNFGCLVEQHEVGASALVEALAEGGGWFKVEGHAYKIMKK